MRFYLNFELANKERVTWMLFGTLDADECVECLLAELERLEKKNKICTVKFWVRAKTASAESITRSYTSSTDVHIPSKESVKAEGVRDCVEREYLELVSLDRTERHILQSKAKFFYAPQEHLRIEEEQNLCNNQNVVVLPFQIVFVVRG
jgi:hypothetical protein